MSINPFGQFSPHDDPLILEAKKIDPDYDWADTTKISMDFNKKGKLTYRDMEHDQDKPFKKIVDSVMKWPGLAAIVTFEGENEDHIILWTHKRYKNLNAGTKFAENRLGKERISWTSIEVKPLKDGGELKYNVPAHYDGTPAKRIL